jgi:predicted DNA-binding protein
VTKRNRERLDMLASGLFRKRSRVLRFAIREFDDESVRTLLKIPDPRDAGRRGRKVPLVTVSMSMPGTDEARLNRWADRLGISRSSLVRRMIEWAVTRSA